MLFAWAASTSRSRPLDCELNEVNAPETINNRSPLVPPPPTQNDVFTAPVDPGDQRLYNEIDNPETFPPASVSPPPVYQLGTCGYYEGLQVTSEEPQPAQSLEQPQSVYDKLSQKVLSGTEPETAVKVPHVKRVSSLPVLRLPSTIWPANRQLTRSWTHAKYSLYWLSD